MDSLAFLVDELWTKW